jgi:hypothetical protein
LPLAVTFARDVVCGSAVVYVVPNKLAKVVVNVLPPLVSTVLVVFRAVVVMVVVWESVLLNPLPLELEIELVPFPRLSTPPTATLTFGGEVLVVAFFARASNATSVFPVVGALIAATIPDWQ